MYSDDAPIRCWTSNLPYAEEAININFWKTAKNDESIIVIDGINNNRSKVEKSLQPKQLYPKGPSMNAWKEVELFIKWRPLLPKKDQDVMCSKPSDKIMAMVKDEINKKKERKESKKKDKISSSVGRKITNQENNNNKYDDKKKRKT